MPLTPGMGMLVLRMVASRGETSFKEYLATLRQMATGQDDKYTAHHASLCNDAAPDRSHQQV
jgi:hypothetical protein